jgi:hypothetical protein
MECNWSFVFAMLCSFGSRHAGMKESAGRNTAEGAANGGLLLFFLP